MAEEKSVKLYGMWVSPFPLLVEWALNLKGVEYEYINEDLPNKSPELLMYNPVHKKIPVLLHDGKPLAESAVIVEYIDETWKDGYPIMPKGPYERAVARFWAKFAEEKVVQAIRAIILSNSEGDQKKAGEDLEENLGILGGALKGNKFFGGESIGYVDIIAGWIPYWVLMLKEVYGVTLDMEREGLAEIKPWADRFLAVGVIKERLPSWDKFLEIFRKHREQLMQAAAKSEDEKISNGNKA